MWQPRSVQILEVFPLQGHRAIVGGRAEIGSKVQLLVRAADERWYPQAPVEVDEFGVFTGEVVLGGPLPKRSHYKIAACPVEAFDWQPREGELPPEAAHRHVRVHP